MNKLYRNGNDFILVLHNGEKFYITNQCICTTEITDDELLFLQQEKFDVEVLTMVDNVRFNVNKLLTNPDWISMVVEEITISIENTKLI
jgi:hypothetical protein